MKMSTVFLIGNIVFMVFAVSCFIFGIITENPYLMGAGWVAVSIQVACLMGQIVTGSHQK